MSSQQGLRRCLVAALAHGRCAQSKRGEAERGESELCCAGAGSPRYREQLAGSAARVHELRERIGPALEHELRLLASRGAAPVHVSLRSR